MIDLSDDDVERARSHDPDAVETVYRALAPAVYGYVVNRTRDRTVAEDVTGDVFLEALRSIHRFEGGAAAMRAWLFRIARNTLVDHLRRESHRRHDNIDDVVPVAAGVGPEEQALGAVELARLRTFVDDLPAEQREVVLLRLVAELPVAEVAALTGRSEGAVKALQHRALRGLERRMSRHDEAAP